MVTSGSYALLIGVAAYRHLRPLSKTITDARDLHDLLAQSGYPPANLSLLLDEQATKAAISDKLDHLARRAGPDDTVLIFFSGHGAQRIGGFEPGEYLCPVEADWHNLRATAISDEEFTTALRAIHAGRVAVFLDACHSGGVGEPKDAAIQVKAGLSEAAYARLAEGRGRVVVASCRPDEVSWELAGMRNGLFTHYLLEGLCGAVVGADGAVRIFDLFDYVSRQVPQHKPQHPLFKGEIELNFAITISARPPAAPSPPAPAPGESAVAPTTGIDPDSVDPIKLRQAMHSAYDRPAFEILCKELGLDYHDLRGETLETKMLYLIDWHRRRRRYAQLVRKALTDHPYLAQELQ
ncbi:MAG: caspase family protein [Anaerolineae bacterium]|nr:caspase family protein [Anaerolineae bacterium]